MRSGRMLIIVGFLVLVGAAVIGGIMWVNNQRQPEPNVVIPGEGTPDVYIPPEEKIEIVVAAQNVIPRGTRVTDDAVKLAEWPRESAPDGALTSIEDAVGRITREDIVLDTPLTDDVLTDRLPDLDSMGSDAALQVPKGMVAYALPVARYSSVAWALQPGDHVDVLISILIVELDEEFQAILPNQSFCVEPPEGEGCSSGTMGRLEVLANGWVVNMSPGEAQRPRLVTQLAVQDATVLRVGDWPGIEEVTPDEEVE
ncbi:MAG: Flp pilus assembly protein CpaB, partial [Chloroflexi bacterium]|nr:Flp pilus assembly protein CpaB [Chloroflexota bacterium]